MEEFDVEKDTTDKYTLRGRVFSQIREGILSGKYKSGDELKESTIGQELGVSRTPVREALRQLELEGLVKIIPNKGAYVNGLSSKDLKDIYSIRSYLEGLCARWACANITEEQIEDLEEIIYLSDFHAQKMHHEQLLELDNKFHDVLYEASNSKMLKHLLKDFHHYVQRVRKTTLSAMERAIESNQEHKAILEALKEKNCDKAEELAHQHLLNTMANIEKQGLENLIQE
ncbi:GntR family transcriptional regulator [Anaeromicropila populeti]|uniref:DNA-binding transcriptional regulator, GntR family n=1 Tax=Anaeromicropila populeti TaxID=37658 RepID=A0A1I6J868_9FIRM|nr:GntR family transcriptional regulator [Anaeromicropila populeti]SFR75158.1 DNA-binding transcriptional regulator, GntR family [Anaeromicropila populeti]